ncbi:M28 family metallopeptidase [Paracidobacterium acidisoli]|uniref:M20/M25/M40 family metallo-hydrolase n=1 Tax=Paracidobacterium acidisoli TaxID=2303751 RepID=A0A372IQE6_9BACT|nr:M28 family metallopeptidase [Paracidobacterium acidisoli]MBT9331549.1 M28 family metallopeptidase [Paracidobacterium acidisoli]
MLKPFLGAVVTGLILATGTCPAPSQSVDFRATGAPLPAAPADPQIVSALRSISQERIHQNIEKLVSFRTRNTLSSMVSDLPPGTGINTAAEWIRSQFEEYSKECGGCLEVKEDVFMQPPPKVGFEGTTPRISTPTRLTNVYAILKGTDPAQAARMYLITGHYDTRASDVMDPRLFAPGANDDSSGTAVSLESARVLSRHKFPATLVFVAVAGEEQGLYGSAHLAALAKQNGWQLEGVLNNDIVGGNTTPGDTLQSKTRVRIFSEGISSVVSDQELHRLLSLGADSDSPSRELAREVLDAGRTYLPASASSATLKPIMILRLDRYLRGGDHRSFNEAGFPAVRVTEWREDFHHQHQTVRTENGVQYGDLIQYDDFSYIAKVARLNTATLATLASAPGTPQDVRMSTHNLDNDSVILWQPPDGAPADTWYQIVWRETDASDWQYAGKASPYHEAVTGSDHTVTVPVSKDNVIFGVRSCDTKGHCSPAVMPVPDSQRR